jgi:hypothetical protein
VKLHVPLIALALAASTIPSFAQKSQEQLAKQRDAKLAEAWVGKQPWITDYAKAKETAKKDGKVILAYFSRSYSP